jgi:hypothetical protein
MAMTFLSLCAGGSVVVLAGAIGLLFRQIYYAALLMKKDED